jgi:hypothetical protein
MSRIRVLWLAPLALSLSLALPALANAGITFNVRCIVPIYGGSPVVFDAGTANYGTPPAWWEPARDLAVSQCGQLISDVYLLFACPRNPSFTWDAPFTAEFDIIVNGTILWATMDFPDQFYASGSCDGDIVVFGRTSDPPSTVP